MTGVVEEYIFTEKDLSLAIQDLQAGGNISIEIQQFISQTDRFQLLQHRLADVQSKIKDTPYYEYDQLQHLKARCAELEEKQRQFKVDLLHYARVIGKEEYGSIEIAKKLRSLLAAGKLNESDLLLNAAELEERFSILEQQLDVETNLQEVYRKLVINSYEFFVKANLTSLNYDLDNRFEKAVFYWDKSLLSARRAAAYPFHVANCLGNYAGFLQNHHRFSEAKRYYSETLEVIERIKVGDNYDRTVAGIYHNLGSLYHSLGDNSMAAIYHEKAFELNEKIFVEGMISFSKTDGETSANRFLKQRMKDTIEYLRSFSTPGYKKSGDDLVSEEARLLQLFALLSRVNPVFPGEFVRDQAEILANLAHNYALQGKIEVSRDYYEQTLTLLNTINSGNSNQTADEIAWSRVGYASMLVGKDDSRAIQLLGEAAQSYEMIFQKDAYRYGLHYYETLWMQCLLYEQLNNRTRAIESCEKAVEVLDKTGIEDALKTLRLARALNYLGHFYFKGQMGIKAIAMWERAIPLMREAAKTEPEVWIADLSETLNDLGILYEKIGRLSEAEASYNESLGTKRQLAKQDEKKWLPKLSNTLNNLFWLYERKSALSEAEPFLKEAIEIRKKLATINPSEWEPKLADNLNNLGGLQYRLGKTSKSIQTFNEALQLRGRLAALDPDKYQDLFLQTATTFYNILRRENLI